MSPAPETVLESSDKRQFTIRSCLGRGGFGEVYRASMTNTTGLEADVALKVLHNDLDIDSQAVQRLRDEGRMLGALVHPAIVRVFDLVILDGRVGLVTEYVEGADLSDCLRGNKPMPPRGVAAVIGRVADALHAAWHTPAPGSETALNLIHRDVKPANIRIGVQGAVKLLDFGVARSSRVNREAHTNTGHMVGSYLYMAPECLQENAFSRASDVFALGATMYEALAGERLFPDQSLRELYVLVLKDDAYESYIQERLSKIDVPASMAGLLMDMLAREPIDRPDAKLVSERCEDLVDNTAGKTLRRWCKERDWPSAQIIPGMLDGRVITEATMANALRPDFAVAPPTKRKPINWGTVFAGFGGLSLVFSLTLAVLVLTLAGVLFMNRGSRVVIGGIDRPPIHDYDTRGFDFPRRIVDGVDTTEEPPVVIPARRPRRVPKGMVKFVVKPAGSAKARLKKRSKVYTNLDRVPHGSYELQVDFGKGYERKGTITVSGDVTITCNGFLQTCD